MIRVTREQLVISEPHLATLVNAKMSVPAAYRINKIIQQVAKELKETEKMRHQIIEKYGKKDEEGNLVIGENGKTIVIPEENRIDFNKEIELLFHEICEISGEPISIALLDNVSMSSKEISAIDPFLMAE